MYFGFDTWFSTSEKEDMQVCVDAHLSAGVMEIESVYDYETQKDIEDDLSGAEMKDLEDKAWDYYWDYC